MMNVSSLPNFPPLFLPHSALKTNPIRKPIHFLPEDTIIILPSRHIFFSPPKLILSLNYLVILTNVDFIYHLQKNRNAMQHACLLEGGIGNLKKNSFFLADQVSSRVSPFVLFGWTVGCLHAQKNLKLPYFRLSALTA